MFDVLMDLPRVSGREALCRLVLVNFNYAECTQARYLLSHWMSISSSSLKSYCIFILRESLRINSSAFASWGVELLLAQLDSPNAGLVRSATIVLEEASMVAENLKVL